MPIGRTRKPSRYVKLQLVEYEGTRYVQSKSWNIHNASWDALVSNIKRILGIKSE